MRLYSSVFLQNLVGHRVQRLQLLLYAKDLRLNQIAYLGQRLEVLLYLLVGVYQNSLHLSHTVPAALDEGLNLIRRALEVLLQTG